MLNSLKNIKSKKTSSNSLTKKIQILLCVFSIYSLGCHYSKTIDHNSTPEGNTQDSQKGTSSPNISDEDVLSFKYVMNNSLQSCKDCHSEGKKSPTLTDYNQITANFSDIQTELSDDSMPPAKRGYKPLTNCQKAVLQAWADMNFPEDSNIKISSFSECATSVVLPANPIDMPGTVSGTPTTSSTPVVSQTLPVDTTPTTSATIPVSSTLQIDNTPTTSAPVVVSGTLPIDNPTPLPPIAPTEPQFLSYDLLKQTSLKTCANCHINKKDPELGSYEDVKSNIQDIISEVSTDSMPPKKKGYDPLSQCQKIMLTKWLDLGTPEKSDLDINDIPECKLAKILNPVPN